MSEQQPSAVDPATPRRSVVSVMSTAAWLAILLGLLVQGLILTARLSAGGSATTLQVIADVTSGVTWSVLVCSGLALGAVVVRHRGVIMGILGLVSAPVAWAAAKGAQRGVQWMLDAPLETIGPLVHQVGAAKTIEYAVLGLLLGRLIYTSRSTLPRHALTGLAVGVVFGAVILWLNHAHAAAAGAALPTARIAAICVNELVFPVGCAVVIYFVARFADRPSALERLAAGGG
jgi:hypothetical protein